MNKLILVYTVAAILAFHSGFAFAGTPASRGPALKKDARTLLQQSEKASFEEIAEIQTKLDGIRQNMKKKPVDGETSQYIGKIQQRLDRLVSDLAAAMK